MRKHRGNQIDRERLHAALATLLYGRDVGESSPAAIGRRLAHVRDCAGVNRATVAEHLDMQMYTWKNYEQGVHPPSASALVALQRQLGINPAWVLTGAGRVLVDDDAPEASSPAQANEWGSAGECPAFFSAKTPAAGARCFRVAGVGTCHGDGTISLCVSLQGPGGGVG